MGEPTGWLKTLKDRIEPAVWFIGTVVVPVIGGLIVTWRGYIFPAIQTQLRDVIQQELKEANTEIKTNINTYNKLFEQIKEKYAKELDSTYYLEKKFVITFKTENQADSGQDVLSTFFYVADKDVVKLFIWSSGSPGVTTDMEISINDGAHKKPQDFQKPSWTDVDITDLVKDSSVLSGYQYPGIEARVYNISIIPKPKLQKPIISSIVSEKHQKEEMVKFNEPKEVVIYGLVIVRRSPFQ
jgi:hypothetical protein